MRFALGPVLFVSAFAVVATVAGCKASVDAKVNAGTEEHKADFDEPMDTRSLQGGGPEQAPVPTALLGARQDLSYGGSTTPRCTCLAVAVGQPTDASFQWAGTRPSIDSETQVVVALSSAGVTCDTGGAGASYWGYEVVGEDVIVVVETAKPGRPIAQGAIIPRPMGSGRIYVRPLDKGVPYGKPQSGAGNRCQVANIGSGSSAAVAPAGTAAPTASPAPASPAPASTGGPASNTWQQTKDNP